MKKLFINARLVDAINDSKTSDCGLFVVDGFIKQVFFNLSKDEIQTICTTESISQNDIFDCQNLTLMPGFIDMHSHFRDPGQCQKETLETGMKAALAGGYTTVVLMPNTNPVISSFSQAKEVMNRAIEIQKTVFKHPVPTIFQSVSLTQNFDGLTTDHLVNLDNKEIPLVTEDGRDVQNSSVFLEVIRKCAKTKVLVSCHSEDANFTQQAKQYRQQGLENPQKKAECFSKAENLLRYAEDLYTYRNLYLADQLFESEHENCKIHIAHISTINALNSLKMFKEKRPGFVSAEVTPHHFSLNDKNLEIVNPPLRPQNHVEAIREALSNDLIDVIATDHAPHTLQDKQNGTPGFTGLETSFSLCNQFLVKENVISLSKLSQKLSFMPAKLLELTKTGLLSENFIADFVLVDLNKEWNVDTSKFFSKGKYSPFSNKKLCGKVIAVFKKGETAFKLEGKDEKLKK